MRAYGTIRSGGKRLRGGCYDEGYEFWMSGRTVRGTASVGLGREQARLWNSRRVRAYGYGGYKTERDGEQGTGYGSRRRASEQAGDWM